MIIHGSFVQFVFKKIEPMTINDKMLVVIRKIALAKKEAKKACNQIAAYEIDQQINKLTDELVSLYEENKNIAVQNTIPESKDGFKYCILRCKWSKMKDNPRDDFDRECTCKNECKDFDQFEIDSDEPHVVFYEKSADPYDTIKCSICGAVFDITKHEIRRSLLGRKYIYCHECGMKLRIKD